MILSTKALLKALAVAAVAGGFLFMKLRARSRLEKLERSGGCVSCSSTNVDVRDGVRTCMDCGYQGRADGGGKVGAGELDGMYGNAGRFDR